MNRLFIPPQSIVLYKAKYVASSAKTFTFPTFDECLNPIITKEEFSKMKQKYTFLLKYYDKCYKTSDQTTLRNCFVVYDFTLNETSQLYGTYNLYDSDIIKNSSIAHSYTSNGITLYAGTTFIRLATLDIVRDYTEMR